MSTGPGTGKRWISDNQDSWIDLRRRHEKVSEDKRRDPRVELRCPVQIEGYKGSYEITDISIGGIFIECDPDFLATCRPGQELSIRMSLPSEKDRIRATVQITNVTDRGIGCHFLAFSARTEEAMQYCYHIFRDTLPIL